MTSNTSVAVQRDHHVPWAEKYRPTLIENVLSHENIRRSITNYMKQKTLPNMLLYGPSGTGKTSLIMTVANEFYGDNVSNMVLILNASEERRIEVVRGRIKQFCQTKPLLDNFETHFS